MNNLINLDLSSNYISILTGVSQCINLSYLNISKNLIEDITPLQFLIKLTTLKASNNKIKDIYPIQNCKKIMKLRLHNNQIFSFERTLSVLSGLPRLLNLSILANPCIAKTKEAKEKLVINLDLEKLDKAPVKKPKKIDQCIKKLSYIRNKLAEDPGLGTTSSIKLQRQVDDLKKENDNLKQELTKVKEIIKKLSISEVF